MSKKPKINIPPISAVVKNVKGEESEEDGYENVEDLEGDNDVNESSDTPNSKFQIPPIPPVGRATTEEGDEDDEEDSPKRRGRPKTIPAKKACAKSMYVILNKLKKIQDITLQDDVYMLAEDAIVELKHLKDIIDEVL